MVSKRYEEKKASGLRISIVNWLILGISCILALCLFLVTLYVTRAYNQAMKAADNHIRLDAQIDLIRETSEHLTSETRMFIVTEDRHHLEHYHEEVSVEKRIERTLEEISHQNNHAYAAVEKALEGSGALMVREIYAMKLVCEACGYPADTLPIEIQETILDEKDAQLSSAEKRQEARRLIFGADYQEAKAAIYSNLHQFSRDILAETTQQFTLGHTELLNAVFTQRILLIVLVVLMFLFSLAIALLVVRPLLSILTCLRKQIPLKISGAYEVQYLAQVYNDVYAQKEASAAQEVILKHKAEHDLMTGLQNRVSAEEHVQMHITDGKNPGILILLDLDDLKGINDTLGHSAGDQAILGISQTLKSHFRSDDVISRIGGDEFMIYLPGAANNQTAIASSLTVLQQKLSVIPVDAAETRYINCSIGCAVQSESANTYEVLFKQADIALYHVKHNRKNTFAFYAPEMEQ